MNRLFIVNPASGGGVHVRDTLSKIGALPKEDETQIGITQYPKHAIEIIKQTVQAGGEWQVFACGGDGTLNEAVCGVAGFQNAALTHYPCGTGNDFVKTFGTPDMFLDFSRLINGREIVADCIDMGKERYSINICCVGVDADAAADMPRYKWALKWGSKMPYNLSVITNLLKGIYRPYNVEIDGVPYDGEYTIITVCNGQVYGGGFRACPDADPADGTLEFLLVRRMSRLTIAKIISTYAAGGYKQLGEYIKHVRGKYIKVSAAKEININSDGETYREKGMTFALSDKKIRFILPEGV